MDIQIRNEPDPGRYVIEVDGKHAGLTEYHLRGDHIYFFIHTEIDDEFQGSDYGTALIRHALDDVRAQGATIIPLCPFVAAFVRRHPEYSDLIEQPMWDRIRGRAKPETSD